MNTVAPGFKETTVGVAFDAKDSNFRRFVQKLLDGGHIRNEAAEEVARHVVEDHGPLNLQQTWLFARDVIEPFTVECVECREPFPWIDAYEMIGTHRRCDLCETRYRKFID